MREIDVVVCEPGGLPRRTRIKPGLQAMQDVVGGSIELLSVGDLDCWVCADGIERGWPLNRVVEGQPLLGPILVTASDREGETVSLTSEQADRAIALLLNSPAIFWQGSYKPPV